MEKPNKTDVYATDESVSPVGIRYGRKQMVDIFGESRTLKGMLDVEAANVDAISQLYPDLIPPEAAIDVYRHASLEYVKPQRVREFEKSLHHDVMAVVKALAEQCPVGGKYVHLFMTSADATETAKAYQIKKGLEILIRNIENTRDILLLRADEWKETPCIIRTHGQHAIPGTFGLPFAYFANSLEKDIDRLEYDYNLCVEGKISGAIGNYAAADSADVDGTKIEEQVMDKLGIRASSGGAQIPARENIAFIMSDLATLGGSLATTASYIKTLKRTEIGEIYEPKEKGQVGSSTMAQKNNPFTEERICSIARVLRGFASTGQETVEMDYARCLTASLSDRIIISEGFVLADYSIALLGNVAERILIIPENIERNLRMTKGTITSERVMTALTKRGMSRQDAHTLTGRCADEAFRRNIMYADKLTEESDVLRYLSADEINEFANPAKYTGKSKEVTERALVLKGTRRKL